MSKLFIYYSNTGNGIVVANKLGDAGYDVRRIFPKKDLPKKFFFKVMSGGFLAGLNVKSKLKDFDTNIDKYDEIVIGSPIWNGRLSTPINKLLSMLDLKDKKVSFVLYAGSGEAKHAAKQINKVGLDANIIMLKEPKKYPEELYKLEEV